MTGREAVERARARAREQDATRPVRGDEPPAIGSGSLGTLEGAGGKREIPPYGYHHKARGIPVCGGSKCIAYQDHDGFSGVCLVDPTDEGEQDRTAHIPGRTPCPLAVQGLFEQLHQALMWLEYRGKGDRCGP